MTTRLRAAAFILAAAFLTAPHAHAQNRATVTLQPDDLPRWDTAGLVGWLGVNKSDVIDTGWNDWYDAGAFTASVGYYWTPHLKTEVQLTAATHARIDTYDNVAVPSEPFPYPRSRQHFFRPSAFSGGASYQFLENTWFHPFLGVGVDVFRESTRIEAARQVISFRDPRAPLILPAESTDWETSVSAHPFAVGGFKWYVAEKVFIRSDLRTSFSSKRAESVVWRAGVGFDF